MSRLLLLLVCVTLSVSYNRLLRGLKLLLMFTNMKAVCFRKADFPHTVSNCTCAATENHLLLTLRKPKHLVRKWLLAGLFLGNSKTLQSYKMLFFCGTVH